MSTEAGHGRGNADLSKKQEEMLQMCKDFFGESLHVEQVHLAGSKFSNVLLCSLPVPLTLPASSPLQSI